MFSILFTSMFRHGYMPPEMTKSVTVQIRLWSRFVLCLKRLSIIMLNMVSIYLSHFWTRQWHLIVYTIVNCFRGYFKETFLFIFSESYGTGIDTRWFVCVGILMSSKYCNVINGVRQGRLLSPLFYNVY